MSVEVETNSGMPVCRPTSVRFDDTHFWVDVEDGRTIGVPLGWFRRLANATTSDRLAFELSAFGIHWENIDEDILVDGLFAGRGDYLHRMSVK